MPNTDLFSRKDFNRRKMSLLFLVGFHDVLDRGPMSTSTQGSFHLTISISGLGHWLIY